jgi:hypothetical protein
MMKLTRILTTLLVLVCISACSNSAEEKTHFPITAFLKEEFARIDSLPIAIILTKEKKGNVDTSVVDKKVFRSLAMELIGIDLQEKKYRNNYQELVLEDVQLGNVSISYTTENTDLPIRKIELNIDASTNKIKSIFAERQDTEKDKMLVRKILWTAATEMMVNTSHYQNGQMLDNLTDRYNWAVGN